MLECIGSCELVAPAVLVWTAQMLVATTLVLMVLSPLADWAPLLARDGREHVMLGLDKAAAC